jgi:hypothetical protein
MKLIASHRLPLNVSNPTKIEVKKKTERKKSEILFTLAGFDGLVNRTVPTPKPEAPSH